jgi:signal peptidase I
MFQFLKVTGESLSPLYQEGDFVLIIKIPFLFKLLRRGDVVVFRQPSYGILIKWVEGVSSARREITVIGAHANSIDSRSFGPISQADIIGKVVWHIRKPAS